jgi:hypothetical protein
VLVSTSAKRLFAVSMARAAWSLAGSGRENGGADIDIIRIAIEREVEGSDQDKCACPSYDRKPETLPLCRREGGLG